MKVNLIHKSWQEGASIAYGLNLGHRRIALILPLWFPIYKLTQLEGAHFFRFGKVIPLLGIAFFLKRRCSLQFKFWFHVVGQGMMFGHLVFEMHPIQTTQRIIQQMQACGLRKRRIHKMLTNVMAKRERPLSGLF